MKKPSFFKAIFVLLTAVFCLLPVCREPETAAVYPKDDGAASVEEVKLTPVILVVGESASIVRSVLPASAINKTLFWESGDPSVVKITDFMKGDVEAVSAGTAVITATATDGSGVSGTCVVTVVKESSDAKVKADRGVIAVKGTAAGIFISWRLYMDDPFDITFNIYRGDTKLNSTPLGPDRTNYQDISGTPGSRYKVEMIWNDGTVSAFSEETTALSTDYIQINLTKPANSYLSDGTPYDGTYGPGDGTVADLDGDGINEIIFFWQPENMRDNSLHRKTGNVYVDAYKLDGTRMWSNFIDLGPNIRGGAQFPVDEPLLLHVRGHAVAQALFHRPTKFLAEKRRVGAEHAKAECYV